MADFYEEYLNSTSKKPFVSFQGRKGGFDTVGHAFVGVGIQIDSGLRIYERLFGLYPEGGSLKAVKSILSPVSGELQLTWDDIAWDTELVVSVDDSKRTSILDDFKDWAASAPEYSLLASGGMNCSVLVSIVATGAGLKVPNGPGSTRPWKFIEALKALN